MKKPLARLLLCGLLALAAGAATVKMAAAGIANPGNVAANIRATPSTAGLVQVRDRHFRRHHGGRHFHHVRPHYRHVRPHHRYVRPYRHYRGPRSGIYLGFGAPYYRPPVYYARPHYIGPRYRRLSRAHIRWCYRHYRSYRASDNTFQPYHGPRRQCRAPY